MTKEHAAALKQAMGPKAAMKFLHAIGSKIAVEGQFVAGDKGGGGGFETMNPQMAEAKIEANMKDRSFMERFNSADPVVRGQARARDGTASSTGVSGGRRTVAPTGMRGEWYESPHMKMCGFFVVSLLTHRQNRVV
jgi:hypothetical protein